VSLPEPRVMLPPLSIGTVALGGLYAPVAVDEAQAVLQTAVERDVRQFDSTRTVDSNLGAGS
jgi:aryl-alcohol dehydrogenase-like predicted oxidoreductase